jgi:hypothetical protein
MVLQPRYFLKITGRKKLIVKYPDVLFFILRLKWSAGEYFKKRPFEPKKSVGAISWPQKKWLALELFSLIIEFLP